MSKVWFSLDTFTIEFAALNLQVDEQPTGSLKIQFEWLRHQTGF